MGTSSSIQYISRLLEDPLQIKDADSKPVQALIRAYPYFLPARYLEAAIQHKQQPYNNKMMATMQLYMGNWLFFCQYMRNALGSEAEMPEAIFEETPVGIYTEKEEDTTLHITEGPGYNDMEDDNNEGENTIVLTNTDIDFNEENITTQTGEELILPIYTEDYFLHQGILVSNDIPDEIEEPATSHADAEEDKSLMVVMSFSEWLLHFKKKNEKEREEQEDKKALKSMWQKEKLAAALEEENDEIPENVFEMAVNSIAKEDDLASESLAEIYAKQGKYDKAIEMYHKLSLRNPQKNAYFARKIEALLKEK